MIGKRPGWQYFLVRKALLFLRMIQRVDPQVTWYGKKRAIGVRFNLGSVYAQTPTTKLEIVPGSGPNWSCERHTNPTVTIAHFFLHTDRA